MIVLIVKLKKKETNHLEVQMIENSTALLTQILAKSEKLNPSK